ncbi:MAG: hypothetical protein EBZ29_08765 [Synechococcaceae bacterium WB9_4xC_028]|nr:hypothetical protein [Synechococcaceae bacterium WB9_4xB_025]NDD69462.1 hypothetical protein [Synechococcaceae bacterium WB9_4xC_028]
MIGSDAMRLFLAPLLFALAAGSPALAFNDCTQIRRLMQSMGASMARNRALIAESQASGKNPARAEQASQMLTRQTSGYRELRADYERLNCRHPQD